jgi:endonuclease YncB( thermonuclease family)
MNPRNFITGLAACVALLSAAGQNAPSARPFERFDGCTIVAARSNDGDSFLVRLPDRREQTFRLYFVDAPENTSSLQSRTREQASYFGISDEASTAVGAEASTVTQNALAKPFTIFTRWRPVFGHQRHFAIVVTASGDDLAELLVSRGLVRIYGTRTPLPDGRDSQAYLARLRQLEEQAKQHGLGGWKR